MNQVIKNCFAGLYALLQTPGGWVCLLSLLVAGVMGLKHVIGDMAFASVFTMLPAILVYCQHRVDIASINNQPPPPNQMVDPNAR
jgi:hypothetical protein